MRTPRDTRADHAPGDARGGSTDRASIARSRRRRPGASSLRQRRLPRRGLGIRGEAPAAVGRPLTTRDLESALGAALAGEIRFDAYTRHLYSTDASLYAIEPLGVAWPRDADDIVAALQVAAEHGVPVLPRGAGTSLAGQTVGRAVVLDMSRYMRTLIDLDAESMTARVQPGVIQDELNKAAGMHRLMFAPDPSTSNRATLGGMIGNNS